ncbi:hypothetical protein KKH03_01555 [Patescibacteria group bacterium]|nr:hypothetical protein [Patescibacteria group bacterium]
MANTDSSNSDATEPRKPGDQTEDEALQDAETLPREGPPAGPSTAPSPAIITEEVSSSAIEVLSSIGPSVPPEGPQLSPENLAMVNREISLGMIDIDRLVRYLENEQIRPSKAVLDLLIEGDAGGERVLSLLFLYADFLTEDQQIRLFMQMNYNARIRDEWLQIFFEDGKLNPAIPEIEDGLMQTAYGINILVLLAFDGKYVPRNEKVLVFAKKLLAAGRFGVEALQRMTAGTQPLFRLPDELRDEFDVQNELYEDSNRVYNFIHDNADYAEKIGRLIEEIVAGTWNVRDPLAQTLGRLRERDETGFVLLKENVAGLTPDYIQAIIEGIFLEDVDADGLHIRAYEGKILGSGGMGRVFSTAYCAGDSKELRFQALKVANESREEIFEVEKDRAPMVREWNNPHINKPLHICSSCIIYETGKNAKDLEVDIDNLPPRRWLQQFIYAMKGAAEYQGRRYIHGDIKPNNVLSYDIPEGRKTVLIDNSPTKADAGLIVRARDRRPFPAWSHAREFTVGGLLMFYIAEDIENRFYGIDNYSIYKTYSYWINRVHFRLTEGQRNVISNAFMSFYNPFSADKYKRITNPAALQKLIEDLEKIVDEWPQ